MSTAITIMIVDDEILAIEDLQNLIPWQQYGFEIIATATSSIKALELYKEFQPRLIFVDIRMPVMDGLEFSRKVMAYKHPVKIILLTAYKDFEYAKQALEIGVSNYLLKHDVNEKNLIGVLRKLRNELENEAQKNQLIREQLLKKIIHGETGDDWPDFLQLKSSEQEKLGIMLMRPDLPYLSELENQDKLLNKKTLFLKGLKLPEDVNWIESIDYDGGGYIIFFGIKKINSLSEERQKLRQLGLQLQKHCKNEYQLSFSISLTYTCHGFAEIYTLYQKIVSAFEYLIFLGREQIIQYEDLPVITRENSPDFDRYFEKIPQYLQACDGEQINSTIIALFEFGCSPQDPGSLKRVCNELFYFLDHFRREKGLPSILQLVAEGKIETDRLYKASDIFNWFQEQFTLAIQQASNAKFEHYSLKMQKALQYIWKYYSEDLTVESVAAVLGISGVYLSQLFKKEIHHTFLDYLTEYRIKKAQVLLAKGNYKIYEVAAMVGYKTSQYFSLVFRKITGMHPVEYREGGPKDETGD
jgi:two-component system response regulator YesN